MAFDPVQAVGVSRRAFFAMPFAFAGLIALVRSRERPLPDPAANGGGPPITVVLFSDSGERLATVTIRKMIKNDAEWRRELSAEQYRITRRKGTEFAFSNRYWNWHATGVYRCVCCGTALFRSQDKFDSGTGWPSFSLPIAAANIQATSDLSLGLERREVLCAKCDGHLGHVFEDGPPPSGLRYCVNSSTLYFRPSPSHITHAGSRLFAHLWRGAAPANPGRRS